MTTQADTRQLPVEIGLPEGAFKGFHKAKYFWQEAVNNLTESAQQARSLTQTAGQAVNTVTEATDKAVDAVTATAEQAKNYLTTKTHGAVDTVTTATSDSVKTITATAQQTKGSLEHALQTPGQLKNTTSEAIQTAISSSVSDWLLAHPVAFRLVQVLIWATNHPILSLVILLFAVAIAWSLIKALGRLIETVGMSLLQAPFKLSQVLIAVGFKSLGKFRGLVNQLAVAKNTEKPALPDSSSKQIQKDKQQRLAEISTRLEVIRQEQNELLQEVAAILSLDK